MIFFTLHHLLHAIFDGKWENVQINCLTALIGAVIYFIFYGYLTEYAQGLSKLFKDWWWYIALVDVAVMAVIYRSYYGRSIVTEIAAPSEDDKWDFDERSHRYVPKEKPQPIQRQINNYYTDNVHGPIDNAAIPGPNASQPINNAAIPGPNATQPINNAAIPGPNATQPINNAAIPTAPPPFGEYNPEAQAIIDYSLEHFQPSDKEPLPTESEIVEQQNDINRVAPLLQEEFSKLDHDPTESEAMRIIENNIDKIVDDQSKDDQSKDQSKDDQSKKRTKNK